jgi:ribosomal protein L11 methyltransferase
VKRPQYTRYALRLEPPAGARAAAALDPAAASAPGSAPTSGLAEVAVRPDPDDDWSGSAAYARGPDDQTLEYADPRAVAAIVAMQPSGWQEEDDGRTLVFWLEDGAEADAETAQSLKRIGALGRLEVARERPGWEDAWRRFHKPHQIGRLYVRPPWYPARDDLLDVVVEAGLAFGTGGHASTRQCLELIQTLAPSSLLDLGAGSGVVSFAALRLGFAPVTGIDIDPVAVHAAAGNAAMNELAPTFLVGDATDPAYPLPAADVVVANIALRPILRLAQRWRPAAGARDEAPPAAGSTVPAQLLLSGLLVEQAAEALAAFPAFAETARTDDGTWLTLHLTRRA